MKVDGRFDNDPLTRVWTSFILRNIYRISHISDLPITKAFLAYYIQDKMEVDVATILSNELFQFMINEPYKTRGATKPLVYLGLIIGHCEKVGVDISTPPLKQQKAPLYLAYI
ncbi:hypothetical protein TanjilG_22222 [Lupinus angustifolius]|uniref:Uncharacterized protein n=1 Tax=Lupinus angustifolius TaxID=3871 RepID=A0A1J7FNC0_LUPAN|nr:hypothetical protein TanjilG_22222 [Lupinus angustifolius]